MLSTSLQQPINTSFSSKIFKHPLWSMVAAFGCYFCVYGFRKPFTAGAYEGVEFFNIGWKSLLISSQILGYLLSKAGGIFFVSSLQAHKRTQAILISITIALISLFFFAICPAPYSLIFLFINGLPLGMVFGYIQGYLEGKTSSELLIASLGASFILADGVSKSVGSTLLQNRIPINWMPFSAGLIYLIPVLFFVWMLTKIPKPSKKDVEKRSKREPMTQEDRVKFVKNFLPGIIGISLIYLMSSLLRGIRSDFALEIWQSLGIQNNPALFSQTEAWVMAGILLINGSLIFIQSNKKAFNASLFAILIGFTCLLITYYFNQTSFSPFWLIVLSGLGIYLPYLTITTSIFERLIAITKEKANVGFLMYIVDFVGYLGYNVLLISSNLFLSKGILVSHFFDYNLGLGIIGIFLTYLSFLYFSKKFNLENHSKSKPKQKEM